MVKWTSSYILVNTHFFPSSQKIYSNIPHTLLEYKYKKYITINPNQYVFFRVQFFIFNCNPALLQTQQQYYVNAEDNIPNFRVSRKYKLF